MFESTKALIRDTIGSFKVNYKQLILFEMAYKLLVLLIFIPLTKMIINASLLEMGIFNLTNTELLKEISNYAVIIALICIVILSFIGVFIEITTITLIANKSRQNIKVSFVKEFLNSIKLLKNTISIYIIPIVILLAVLGPVTQIGLYTSLIKSIKIPDFIVGELFKIAYGKVIMYSFLFIMIIVLSRWIYSIIAVSIEDINLKQAFENSIKINKNSKGKTILYVLTWAFINFLLKLILTILYIAIAMLLIKFFGDRSTVSEYIFILGIVVFLTGYSLVSLVTIPLTITFVLELYYKFINYKPYIRKYKVDNIQSKNKILNSTIIVLFIISVIVTTATSLVDSYSENVSITAHRGSSLTAPENTLVSIEHAVQKRADYAEIDVMTTKDNEVVLFHDSTLKRIDKSNRQIKNMTLEEVKKVDNGSYFSEEFKGATK